MNTISGRAVWVTVLLAAASAACAQEGGEVITLEESASGPVEAGQGFLARKPLRPNPGYYSYGGSDGLMPLYRPSTAITLRKRAENVALAITLVNEGRSAEIRNREMFETLSHLLDQASEAPGIRVHNGALTLSTRDRKLGWLSSFSQEPATRVSLYVLGELPEGKSALEVTNQIKSFLSSVERVGATKIIEGSVGLSIREPERFRRELIAAIIADMHFVKTTLGDDVTINLNGIDQRISVRQFSDVEVELSIPYGYSVEYSVGSAGGDT